MNKVLLINSPFNISKEKYDSSVSVGLLSIASFLHQQNVPVQMIDGARQADYLDLIRAAVKDCQFAGISVMTSQIAGALEISRLIREVNPECKIVWGGSHPTFFPKQTAAHELVDAVCISEGEVTLWEIAQGKDFSQIDGIVYKTEAGIIVNAPRKLHDPAQMPLFNWDLVPGNILENLTLVPSLTSRGCPHRCTFCINAILKNCWRPRTRDQVLEDLQVIKEKKYFAGKKIRFWDENFFVDIARARGIVEGMISRGLATSWETTIRADYIRAGCVDDALMAKLKQSGCYLLSFGAESGSPEI